MKERGFSLFEVLIVLAIIVLVIVARFSHFSSFYTRNNEQFFKRQLITTIEHAREIARTSRQRTIVCGTSDLLNCNIDAATHIISFVDSNNDGRVHDKQQIIFSEAVKLDGKLYWRTYPNYRNYLAFDPVGFLHADNGSIWYCDSHKEKPRWMIVINKTGRIREQKPNVECGK